jgi:hypothetical protein
MSEIKVNKISQRSGTAITLGNSGTDFQLPSGAELVAQSGSTITIAAGATITNSGTASGFGPTGAVSWDTTKKTTGFTAVSGVGYFCDTTSSAFTATLPAAPSAGAIVAIADYNGTAATNAITVGRNSSNIDGSAGNFTININYASITFIYVDATVGWRSVDTSNRDNAFTNNYVAATGGTILTCGDFKTHVFTGPGTFTVTNAGTPTGSNSVEYLVVAGGAGGGGGPPGCNGRGGGGGAGGFRQNYPSPVTTGLPVSIQGYPITVGGGGAGGTNPTKGVNGNPSIFSTITSSGGGGGGSGPVCNKTGSNGGSGGGGGTYAGPGTAGSGNTPPTSPSQGNNGGNGLESAPNYGAGGGGGAGGVGGNGTAPAGGPGGVGSPIATTVFGPTAPSYGTPGPAPGRYFAGGGGGSIYTLPICAAGTGGAGGGGRGGSDNNNAPGRIAGVPGTANTGGGGGGSTNQTCGGSGGSGIVVIRYKFQ